MQLLNIQGVRVIKADHFPQQCPTGGGFFLSKKKFFVGNYQPVKTQTLMLLFYYAIAFKPKRLQFTTKTAGQLLV